MFRVDLVLRGVRLAGPIDYYRCLIGRLLRLPWLIQPISRDGRLDGRLGKEWWVFESVLEINAKTPTLRQGDQFVDLTYVTFKVNNN